MGDSDAEPNGPSEGSENPSEERRGSLLDRWENPEARWGNPERDLPNVPQVRIPEVPEDVDVDPELARAFWVSVFYANVALGAVSLGLMLVYFRGQWKLGGASVFVGLFAAVRLYTYYHAVRRRRASDSDGAEDDSEPPRAGVDAAGQEADDVPDDAET